MARFKILFAFLICLSAPDLSRRAPQRFCFTKKRQKEKEGAVKKVN
jgi:hypothetical protein